MSETALCELSDIPNGGSAGFVTELGARRAAVFAVRQGDTVFVYENSCPHIGSPLDNMTGSFLNDDETHIECGTHGALFQIDDGVCIAGPCAGDVLSAVMSEVRNGKVFVIAA